MEFSPVLKRNTRLLCSFLLLITNLFCCDSVSINSPSSDQLALLKFKDQVTQDPLGSLNSWNINSSLHFCNWKGITCDPKNGRVTELFLESQSLIGTLSPYVGNLTFLRLINLENNSFHGEIPLEIGRLLKLEQLRLSNNSFVGEIPASLSNCSELIDIHLSSNSLTGKLPEELGSLSKLFILGLRLNNLNGLIPPSFGNLSSLRHITLTYNNLEGSIPDSFGRMPSLQFIRIGANNLSGSLPSSFWNLSSLIEIYVSSNQLQGSLPTQLGLALPNLQNFGIASNKFYGTIPSSISNITGLDYLDIANNSFYGLAPADLGRLHLLKWIDFSYNNLHNLSFLTSLINCSNLERLILDGNRFSGILPYSVANLSTKLEVLRLGRNQIYGTIPEEIENLVNLTQLSINHNMLTGTVPLSIGKLQKLYRLDLNGNELTGEIPFSLGDITQLSELHLQSNSLVGRIPSSFGNYQSLRKLDLSCNELNGTISRQVISSFSYLTHLNISHNSLTGSVPIEVGIMGNLEVMDVSKNKLSGEIPSTIRNCLKLEGLYIEENIIQGKLSSLLLKLQGIQYLNVSSNNLYGEIPDEVERFRSLRSLDISFNDIQGQVPTRGVFSNASAISIVGNEKLCGGIPELKLPSCLANRSNRKGKSFGSKVIIVLTPSLVLSLIFIITCSIVISRRRKKSKRRSPMIAPTGNSYPRVSYEELRKATNGFALENLIGTGSFGSVYKGILGEDGIHVAVKVINLQQRGASKSFIAECEALRRTRHRNVIKILTTCSSIDSIGNEFKALVYKFFPNGSLENWLHPNVDEDGQKFLSFNQRLNIAIDVASALDYLHHHSGNTIVHCDLKPSNILLDDQLTGYVGDFGLAKVITTDQNDSFEDYTTSSISILKGSIGYIAPEYGVSGGVSTSGDVYSYGIMLLEMFTGKKPVDEMFKDGLNLRKFALTRLYSSDKTEIIEQQVLWSLEDQQYVEEEWHDEEAKKRIMEACLVEVIRVGVACCVELEVERMDIHDVLLDLQCIRDTYAGSVSVNPHRHQY